MAKQVSLAFEKSDYNVRFLKAVYGRSKSSGNPMWTVDFELAGNDKALTTDKKTEVDINGVEGRLYITFTAKEKLKLQELFRRLELPPEQLILDAECTESNHPDPKLIEGILVRASVSSKELFARSAPKGECMDPETGKKIPAQKEGDLIKGKDGKSISQGFEPLLMWSEIYYKVEEVAS